MSDTGLSGHRDLSAVRRDYQLAGLSEAAAAADPIEQFDRWYDDAQVLDEPNAMLVATADADGRPSVRAVLLKEYSADGFVFFTNLGSRKARELTARPQCALDFPWFDLQRQVRVEGVARRLDRAADEAYFATRPRGSQIGAWASAQSSVTTPEDLAASYADAEARFADDPISCPPFWGGFVVVPEVIEFWQGRTGRMHDRLRYRRDGVAWVRDRLAP